MAETVRCAYCQQEFPVKKMKQDTFGQKWICKNETECMARALAKGL